MQIGKHNTQEKVLLIAEIGNNHEGSYTLAEEMIGLAADAGADAVKFQTIIPERLVSIKQKKRIQQLKKFQLSFNEFSKLAKVANNAGIIFLSTPFDIHSVPFLNDIMPAFKIASGDNNFFPLIEEIARSGKPIIMSTGFMDLNEVKKSADFIQKIWNDNTIDQDLALLHCVSSYPTPSKEANLLAIRELELIVDTVGYSDHTIGIEAALFSVAVGARILEKHFTIDNNYSEFRDHQLSVNPKDFSAMVSSIRNLEKMLGPIENETTIEENINKVATRRSIVAMHDLKANHILSNDDLNFVRPSGGIEPDQATLIVGKTLKQPIKIGEKIKHSMLN